MKWRYQHTVLALALGAFFSTLFLKFSISTVVPQITTELDASKGTIGLALTGMWIASAIAQYPSGVFGDRYGERSIIIASLLLTAVGAVLMSAVTGYATFFVSVVVIGLGTGLYIPVASTLLTKQFDENGKALSIHIAGGNLSGVFAPVAAAYVAIQYGWRAAPLLCILLIAPLLLLFAHLTTQTAAAQPDMSLGELFAPGRSTDILTRPEIVFSMTIGIIGLFAFQAIASFFPTFLVEYHGFSLQKAGTLFGVVFGLSAMSLPVVGKITDLLNYDFALILSLLVLSSGIGIALLLPGEYALVAVVVVGAGISWGGAIQSRYVANLSASEVGTGFGLIRTVTGLVGSLASVVVGVLADIGGWPIAYGFVIGLLSLAIISLFLNRKLGIGL